MIADDPYIGYIFCMLTWDDSLTIYFHLLYSDIRYRPLIKKPKSKDER